MEQVISNRDVTMVIYQKLLPRTKRRGVFYLSLKISSLNRLASYDKYSTGQVYACSAVALLHLYFTLTAKMEDSIAKTFHLAMSNWLAKNMSTIFNEIALSAAICVRIITHASIAEIIYVLLGLFRWHREGWLVTCIIVFASTLLIEFVPVLMRCCPNQNNVSTRELILFSLTLYLRPFAGICVSEST